MFLFRHGPKAGHALDSREPRQPVVTTAVKAITRRITHKSGRKLKGVPSEEGNSVQRVVSSALATLHDKRRKPTKGQAQNSTVQTLPDDVLLEIFHFHREAAIEYGPWKWHRLAQVCRRWRSVVFAYPRHLDLRIVSTYDKPIRKAPKFWHALPIIVRYPPPTAPHPVLTPSDEDNIFDILEDPDRIREIDLDVTRPLLTKFALSSEGSFPALDHLRLQCRGEEGTVVLPSNFLDGPAPRLRVLHLEGIVIPMLPRLLSSSTSLVSLRLEDITRDGCTTAEDLANGLATATQLKSLVLGFHPSTIAPSSPIGLSPLSSRIALPSLTEFRYEGASPYLRSFVTRINVPIIEKISVSFFSDYAYDNQELFELTDLGDVLRPSRSLKIDIRLSKHHMVFSHSFSRIPSSPGLFRFQIPYRTLRPIPPLVTQVRFRSGSHDVLPQVTHLEIEACPEPLRQSPACWLNLFRTLTGLKTLHVIGKLGSRIAFALAQITGEEVREIMPALQELHFGPDTPSSTPAAIGPFITERQLYGLPVSVHFKKLNWVDGRWGER